MSCVSCKAVCVSVSEGDKDTKGYKGHRGSQRVQRPQRTAGVMRSTKRSTAFVTFVSSVLALLTAFVSLSAQQPVFRAGTRLTVVDVTVVDKQGRPVEGLTAADFTITEDGVPQTITTVAYQQMETNAAPLPPVPAAPAGRPMRTAPTVQPTISASAAGDVRYRNRRLLVLYFDLSAMPPPDQMRAYTAARKFMDEQIKAQDLVAIMTFEGGAVRVRQDFTADRVMLKDVLDTLIYGEQRDANDMPDVTTDVGTAFGQDDAEFNILNTDRQLSALQTAATMLRPLPAQAALA